MTPRNLLAILLAVGLFVASFPLLRWDPVEVVEGAWDNYAQAHAEGSKTWLPASLPRSAVDIEEGHNLDLNTIWFEYDAPATHVPAGCQRSDPQRDDRFECRGEEGLRYTLVRRGEHWKADGRYLVP